MADTGQNFVMWSGDVLAVQFTTTNADGTPYDLTGASLAWAMGATALTPPVVTKTTPTGITINSPATAGIFTVNLVEADTAGINGILYHEARVTDSGGNTRVLATGNATINPSNL